MNIFIAAIACVVVTMVIAEKDCMSPGHRCVHDCTAMANGDYPSCSGCTTYVTCADGRTYLNRPCPQNQYYDDFARRCDTSTNTCGACSTMSNFDCVTWGGTCLSTCGSSSSCGEGYALYASNTCDNFKRCCIKNYEYESENETTISA